MLVVGLTGGIASGKSTVSNYLQKLGAAIIDTDNIAREIVEPYEKAWWDIRAVFGEDFFKKDNSLDRKKLGKVIFSSAEKREKLNAITHPEIIKKTQQLIDECKKNNYPLIVVDAPLLIETGMDKLVDEIWVVQVEKVTQIKRLMKRDNISWEEAEKRISSQMSTEDKLKVAHRTISNEYGISDTLDVVKNIWDEAITKKHFKTK